MGFMANVSNPNSSSVPSPYQVGGSLPIQSKCYVTRPADDELYTALRHHEFCYVLNSRQMGKSSLQVRAMERLRQDQVQCVSLDLTTFGNQHVTPEQWYASIIHDLMVGFDLKLDFMAWWDAFSHVSLAKRLSLFLETILLNQVPDSVVIFIDEIDSVLSLAFPCDDFFALLRSCYNRRTTHPEYQRLTFVLLGVANPSDFILDKQRTPFNIGHSIDLQGFTFERSSPLLAGLTPYFVNDEQVLHAILEWTHGQPFLTQKVCQIVGAYGKARYGDRPGSGGGKGSDSGIEELDPQAIIAQLVQQHLLENWEAQDEPEHLRTIRNRLLYDDTIASRLLGLYQRILMGDRIPADVTTEQLELRLSGLVIESQGMLTIKNRIYRQIFTPVWVEQQLANLRPYTAAINSWLGSHCKDDTCLLEGLNLKAALAWAEQKHLSDLDYRFLSASQEKAQATVEQDLASETSQRENAQIALQAAKVASQLLGQARSQARQQKYAPARRKRWAAGVSFVMLGLMILLRETGALQALEWGAFDAFVRLRPTASTEPRITVVTVDESDIQALGQFPISDQVLAQLLTTLDQHQPRMIGLDIYRDLPVEPGHDVLTEVLQTTPNIIGIEKVIGTPTPPPPSLVDTGQYGFADQILDGDGTVRRSLLSIYLDDQPYFSLGLQLTLGYLASENIQPQQLSNNRMQVGRSRLVPLTENAGGYARADMGGYQILLNYYGEPSQFQTLSLEAVLDGDISPEVVRDRIILIGMTAPTVNDLLLTPYSRRINGVPTQMPGVFIHANIVSQLLNAALDGRPLMKVGPKIMDYLWIFAWIIIGAIVGIWPRRTLAMASVFLLLAISLWSICFMAFLGGWWIPWVPSVLGLAMTAIALTLITSRQSERLFLRRIVREIMANGVEQPAATQIALEYLKQGENQRNQEFIDALVAELPRS